MILPSSAWIKETSLVWFVRDLTRLGTSWYLTCSIAWIYFWCWPSRYSSQVMSLRGIFAHIHNWLWNTILHRLIKSAIKSNNCQHSVINFQHKRCDYNNNDKFYLHLGMCCVIHQLRYYDAIFFVYCDCIHIVFIILHPDSILGVILIKKLMLNAKILVSDIL